MRLEGKRVLVVGASSGLGRETAFAAAREGARVCLAARRSERIREAAQQASEIAGQACFALPCDVQDEASCSNLVTRALEQMGGLDALVYSPAISTFGPIEEIDSKAWHTVFATNVIGVSLILNAAIGALSRARGKVVVYSSIVIDDSPPRPQQASYVVSKTALERLIEAWQGEHRDVGFTSIASGDTLTEFGLDHETEKLGPIVQRWGELDYMYGRMMEAASVAEQAINALCARESVRRIAITPAYPGDRTDPPAESGRAAVEYVRRKNAE